MVSRSKLVLSETKRFNFPYDALGPMPLLSQGPPPTTPPGRNTRSGDDFYHSDHVLLSLDITCQKQARSTYVGTYASSVARSATHRAFRPQHVQSRNQDHVDKQFCCLLEMVLSRLKEAGRPGPAPANRKRRELRDERLVECLLSVWRSITRIPSLMYSLLVFPAQRIPTIEPQNDGNTFPSKRSSTYIASP